MGQNHKEIAEIALKRREAATPKEYLLPDNVLSNLPGNLTTVPKSSGHFSTEEIEIIESNAEDILLKIKEKIWTSLEVTKAFCKAAVVAQQLVRLFCPSIFETLLTWKVDELLDRDPLPRSPSTCQVP
jgi:amidase